MSEHVFKDTNRHLVEIPDSYAIARWPRDGDVVTICKCILGTLKYEPHGKDVTALRDALENLIQRCDECMKKTEVTSCTGWQEVSTSKKGK